MIKLNTIGHKIDARILHMLNVLGVNVVEFKDIKHEIYIIKRYNDCGASYNATNDFIAVNETLESLVKLDVNSVVLHELVHWTGHESRLNRKTIYRHDHAETEEDYDRLLDTEERIAQEAAYIMAKQLGLHTKQLEEFTKNYRLLTPKADLCYVEQAIEQVSEYINSKLRESRAA